MSSDTESYREPYVKVAERLRTMLRADFSMLKKKNVLKPTDVDRRTSLSCVRLIVGTKRPSETPLSPKNGAVCIPPARTDCQPLDPDFSEGNHAVRLTPCGTIRPHAA